MQNNVVIFPLNEDAKYRLSVLKPVPKIPDELIAGAIAELDRLAKADKSERAKHEPGP
jgi:hypothetical protein